MTIDRSEVEAGPTAGELGDVHELSIRARRYANAVVYGDEWPLSAAEVDLDRVTFETSTRMRRKHGVCEHAGDGECTVRLSERTYERAGFESVTETIRHELVHVHQYQDAGEGGHGESFRRWVEPLSLSGRCSSHYERGEEDYRYTFHCPDCGLVGGRHRLCKTVRVGVEGGLYCQRCDGTEVIVRGAEGAVLDPADVE